MADNAPHSFPPVKGTTFLSGLPQTATQDFLFFDNASQVFLRDIKRGAPGVATAAQRYWLGAFGVAPAIYLSSETGAVAAATALASYLNNSPVKDKPGQNAIRLALVRGFFQAMGAIHWAGHNIPFDPANPTIPTTLSYTDGSTWTLAATSSTTGALEGGPDVGQALSNAADQVQNSRTPSSSGSYIQFAQGGPVHPGVTGPQRSFGPVPGTTSFQRTDSGGWVTWVFVIIALIVLWFLFKR